MCTVLRCLICNQIIQSNELLEHRVQHPNLKHYGIMWPMEHTDCDMNLVKYPDIKIPTYSSRFLAEKLGVGEVFIRDEGQNSSGSMKDYPVKLSFALGLQAGFKVFSVISSGNHAASLVKFADHFNCRVIVFTLSSSSKIPFLVRSPSALVIGIKDCIFEEAYELATKVDLGEQVYNANVYNDRLLGSFDVVASQIIALSPLPTHILAGVGNGTYLAGIALGIERSSLIPKNRPKIIPIGMQGAFPAENAFKEQLMIYELSQFQTDEGEIDAAEGAIAIASYSLPQLMYGLKLTGGFPLGGITNKDLRKSYLLLVEEENLMGKGAIPEPTGIMGLAAAIKYRGCFGPKSVVHISFTGHGIKDLPGIRRLVPEIADDLEKHIRRQRADLALNGNSKHQGGSNFHDGPPNLILVEKMTPPGQIKQRIDQWLKEHNNDNACYFRHTE